MGNQAKSAQQALSASQLVALVHPASLARTHKRLHSHQARLTARRRVSRTSVLDRLLYVAWLEEAFPARELRVAVEINSRSKAQLQLNRVSQQAQLLHVEVYSLASLVVEVMWAEEVDVVGRHVAERMLARSAHMMAERPAMASVCVVVDLVARSMICHF